MLRSEFKKVEMIGLAGELAFLKLHRIIEESSSRAYPSYEIWR